MQRIDELNQMNWDLADIPADRKKKLAMNDSNKKKYRRKHQRGKKMASSYFLKGRKKKIILAAVVIGVIAVVAVAYIFWNNISGKRDADTNSAENVQQDSGLAFPYELADGKLKVNSLFQYSGLNPDCNNEEGEDIAALEIENQSDEFCESAEIHVVMQDDTELSFKATNIPAGKKIWVFEKDNQSVEQDSKCKKMEDDSRFGKESLMEDQISVSVDDTEITVGNLTGEEITDVTVGCHCLFEDTYFGGVTYSYPAGAIPADSIITVDASDCYMGTAEVVCISKKEE